jgi:hypothetical protein
MGGFGMTGLRLFCYFAISLSNYPANQLSRYPAIQPCLWIKIELVCPAIEKPWVLTYAVSFHEIQKKRIDQLSQFMNRGALPLPNKRSSGCG